MNLSVFFALLLLCAIVTLNFGASVTIRDRRPQILKDEDSDGELKTFTEVEMKMRKLIDGMIKKMLPYVIRASDDIRLSGKCMAGIFKLVIGMQRLQDWAIKMVDATGKPPSGVIQGTSMSLGDFDECINVRVGRGWQTTIPEGKEYFHGKYCTVECKLPKGLVDAVEEFNDIPQANRSKTQIANSKTFFRLLKNFGPYIRWASFRFGVCIPSLCGADDLGSILSIATKQIGFPLKVLHCQEKEKLKLDTGHAVILTALGTIIAIVVFATIGECYFRNVKMKGLKLSETKAKMYQITKSLSVLENSKKLFNVNGDNHPLPVVRGIIFITVIMNILAHTYFMYNRLFFLKYSNMLHILDIIKQFSFALIANGSNGVENYFFYAGFMVTFMRWRLPSKNIQIDVTNLFVKPYLRMTFLQLLAISLFLLTPFIGYGPFWGDFVGPNLENCRRRWWTNILYIQNYWAAEDACLYHTWVFATVMQCYALSVLIVWLLIRKPNVGLLFIIAIVGAGMAAVGATVFVKQLPGALAIYLVDLKSGPEMWNTLYIQTFDHIGPYCIGLLTGYILAKYQHNLQFKKLTVTILWCVSIASFLAVVFGLYHYRCGNVQMNAYVAILYAMLNRNVYSLFLAWFTVACATGNAGFVSKLLSWKALIPGYKLSFLAYLIHLIVIYYHVGILRERIYLSHEENIINYFGYLLTSFLLAYLCYVLFQAPYTYIESIAISKFHWKQQLEIKDDTKKMKSSSGKIARDNSIDEKSIRISGVSKDESSGV